MTTDQVRIAGVVRESIVDGPGIRFTIFTQGCPHHCPGCHNETTHSFDGGNLVTVEKLLQEIDKNPLLSGVTFSGGEPFCQPEPLCSLAAQVKERGLNVITYSGYTYEELEEMGTQDPHIAELLRITDFLIDGPFILAERDLELPFRGSKNQRYIDMKETRRQGKIVLVE